MKTWWSRRTLRFRLAAWYGIGGTILLTAFSATVYLFVESQIAQPLDRELREALAIVRKNLEVTEDGRALWKGRDPEKLNPWPAANPWFEIWNEEGQLVRRYWPFNDARLENLPAAPPPGHETISVFSVSSEIRLRVLSVPLHVDASSREWMLRVITLHEPVVNALGALAVIIAVALPIVIIALVVGGYAITRRWLKPLERIIQEADQISVSRLSRRLQIPNPYDELGRLAIVFNRTLSRLEDSFVTLDRFVADASQELITPLAALRAAAATVLRDTSPDDPRRAAASSMLDEAARLQRLVEKLLLLARAEGGSSAVQASEIRLDQLARECVEAAEAVAAEKKQQLVLAADACAVVSDSQLLRQVLQILIENALKYSPVGSAVQVEVQAADEACELSVTDSGPGVPVEHRARINGDFFRTEQGRRGSQRGGFGLGLATAKAYLRLLGARLRYEPVSPSGSRFVISIPPIGVTSGGPIVASSTFLPT